LKVEIDIPINNNDHDLIPRLGALSDAKLDTGSDESDDADVLEAEDIARHYWRGDNKKNICELTT
jgi:hypothetical protein